MSVEDDQILIMVEQAERAEAIDPIGRRRRCGVAEEAIAAAGDDELVLKTAQAAKRRAENRILVAGRH